MKLTEAEFESRTGCDGLRSGAGQCGLLFIEDEIIMRKPEKIENTKNSATASFRWKFTENDAHGVSIGKASLPIRQM